MGQNILSLLFDEFIAAISSLSQKAPLEEIEKGEIRISWFLLSQNVLNYETHLFISPNERF